MSEWEYQEGHSRWHFSSLSTTEKYRRTSKNLGGDGKARQKQMQMRIIIVLKIKYVNFTFFSWMTVHMYTHTVNGTKPLSLCHKLPSRRPQRPLGKQQRHQSSVSQTPHNAWWRHRYISTWSLNNYLGFSRKVPIKLQDPALAIHCTPWHQSLFSKRAATIQKPLMLSATGVEALPMLINQKGQDICSGAESVNTKT